MKTLKEHIVEGLKIGAKTKVNTKPEHKYHPKSYKELKVLIMKLIKERGDEADLNDIDTSDIIDMSYLFSNNFKFNGNVSGWDVRKVTDMRGMFYKSNFTSENGDISGWDVSNAEDMKYMFAYSKFNGDISNWDVSNVNYGGMSGMFYDSPLQKNPPKWYKE